MRYVTLTQSGPTDSELIRDIAYRTWKEHYPSIISHKQIDYMLELMYSSKSIEEQMLQKKHLFFLIGIDDETMGFISVHRESDSDWILNKFYLELHITGKGFGTLAFEKLKKVIRPEKITLTVNRLNYKSINFYFKLGFKINRVVDIFIGEGFIMEDFVMVWEKN